MVVLKEGAEGGGEAVAELTALVQLEARGKGFQGRYGQKQGRTEPERCCFLLKICLQCDVPVASENVCLSLSKEQGCLS